MKSVWPKIPRVGVPRNDPRFVFKKGLLAALPAEVVPLESARDSLALVDLSGISEKAVPVFEKKWLDLLETKARVLTPSFADKAKWGKLPQSLKPFTGECHPLLSWTVAERIAAIRKNKISGRLVSFRLIWNVPGAASNGLSNRVEFEKLLLPELLLLSETLAGSEIKKIHFEISQKSALVFGLLTFENGVVGEWDVNAALPWTMEPMRFLHAYFTQGAVTNLPLSGYANTGGSVLATAKKSTRPVYESGEFEGGDECENAYGFFVRDVLRGGQKIELGTGLKKRQQILAARRGGS